MKFNAIISDLKFWLGPSAPATAAFAQADTVAPNDSEMQALTATKVTAADAVAATEIASGGKVVELSLDMESAIPAYRGTAVSISGAETNYLVDATTGKAVLFLEAKASDRCRR